MKRVYFLVTLLVVALLAVSFVSALWPFDIFTGKIIYDDNTPFSQSVNCRDSDDGVYATIGGVVFTRTSFYRDVCKGSSKLYYNSEGERVRGYSQILENYCLRNSKRKYQVMTSEQLGEGYCVYKEVEVEGKTYSVGEWVTSGPFCTDSDAASDEQTYEKGYVVDATGTKYWDYCTGNTLNEYSCGGDDGNSVVLTPVECDYICRSSERACVRASFTCEDSDGGGDDQTDIPGAVVYTVESDTTISVDKCTSDNSYYIEEYFCDRVRGVKSMTVKCNGLCKTSLGDPDNIYLRGRQIAYCEPQPESCTDSDEDETDPEAVAGTVSVTDVYGRTTTYSDACRGRNVLEFSCDGTKMASNIAQCGDICVDGACLTRGDRCVDSDGGYKLEQKGTVTNYKGDGTVISEVSDFCVTETAVAELGCSRKVENAWGYAGVSKTISRIHLKYQACRNGCDDGVCLPAPTAPTT